MAIGRSNAHHAAEHTNRGTAMADSGSWTKSPAELAEAFAAAMAAFPEAQQRKMFGYPAAFLNGNMVTGLHQSNWVVRLAPPDLEAVMAEGGRPFEPMAGRPMTGFATLPPAVLSDPKALEGWLQRAYRHAATMPPKEPAKRR
jgi:TfoX/Sxy family transcriptional regulator of competence genes